MIKETIPGSETSSQSNWDKQARQKIAQPVIKSSESTTTEEHNNAEGRIPPKLERCKECNQFIYSHEEICPHCQTDVKESNARYEENKKRWEYLMTEIQKMMSEKPLSKK